MSDATRAKIAEAIQEHARDEWDGDLIVDWVITAATIGADETHSVGTIYSREPAPTYIARGLLSEALTHLDE